MTITSMAIDVGRVVAGFVGATALYFAFFLYKDEEGIWTNRLETLWLSIYDRAKVVDSTRLALINKISGLVSRFLNQLFGHKLLSLKAVLVSIYLSLLMGLLTEVAFNWFMLDLHKVYTRPEHSNLFRELIDIEWDMLHVGGPYKRFLPLTYFNWYGPAGIALLCVVLLARKPNRLALGICSLPLIYLAIHNSLEVLAFRRLARGLGLGQEMFRTNTSVTLCIPLALLISICFDFGTVFILRRLLRKLTNESSWSAVTSLIAKFTLYLSFLAVPLLAEIILRSWEAYHHRRIPFHLDVPLRDTINFVQSLDFVTVFYMLIPLGMLVLALSHRLFWPTLSRFTHPLVRTNIFENKKTLIAVGSLCLIFTFNLEKVGAKAALDLLAK